MQSVQYKVPSQLLKSLILFYISFNFFFHLRNEINLVFERGYENILIIVGAILISLIFIPFFEKIGKFMPKLVIYVDALFIGLDLCYKFDLILSHSIWSLAMLSIMGFIVGNNLICNSWKEAYLEWLNVMLVLGSAIFVCLLWFPINADLIHDIIFGMGFISIVLAFFSVASESQKVSSVKHLALDWISFAIRIIVIVIFNFLLIYGMFSRQYFEVMYKIFGYRGNRYFVEAEMIQISMGCIFIGLFLSVLINQYFQRKICEEGSFSTRNWTLLFTTLLSTGIIIWVLVEIPAPFSEYKILVFSFFGLLGFSEGMIYTGFFILQYSNFIRGRNILTIESHDLVINNQNP